MSNNVLIVPSCSICFSSDTKNRSATFVFFLSLLLAVQFAWENQLVYRNKQRNVLKPSTAIRIRIRVQAIYTHDYNDQLVAFKVLVAVVTSVTFAAAAAVVTLSRTWTWITANVLLHTRENFLSIQFEWYSTDSGCWNVADCFHFDLKKRNGTNWEHTNSLASPVPLYLFSAKSVHGKNKSVQPIAVVNNGSA